jgi:hypothetical protein
MEHSDRALSKRQFLIAGSTPVLFAASQRYSNAQAQAPAVVGARRVRDRLEEALTRIVDPHGEGARACLTIYSEASRAAADAADARARVGVTLGPLDGAIVGIKDLFDVAGEVTRAGSKILPEDSMPAAADAVVVRRLRAGGAVIVAKNNMSEFAATIVGANAHYGTPIRSIEAWYQVAPHRVAPMLKSGLPEVRNNAGGHGTAPDALPVPAYIAAYALHLSAASIVMVVEALSICITVASGTSRWYHLDGRQAKKCHFIEVCRASGSLP